MLSGALQRNAKHEARLSNISGYRFWQLERAQKKSEMESLASPRKLSGLRCSFASLRMTTNGVVCRCPKLLLAFAAIWF
jgi:hypothetical protein